MVSIHTTQHDSQQVEDQKFVDYKGDYEVFLEQNEDEAEKIKAIEDAQREVEKSQIKAKSKVCLWGGRMGGG